MKLEHVFINARASSKQGMCLENLGPGRKGETGLEKLEPNMALRWKRNIKLGSLPFDI